MRRFVALANPIARTDAASVGIGINLALLALLLAGLALSLWNRPSAAGGSPES